MRRIEKEVQSFEQNEQQVSHPKGDERKEVIKWKQIHEEMIRIT